MTKDRKFMGVGAIGTAVAALCCFTPLLVVSLGALGLSALVGWWLDLILFPMLGFFVIVLGYGVYLRLQQRRGRGLQAADAGEGKP